MDTLVIFPDLGADANDQTYYVDGVYITGATIAQPAPTYDSVTMGGRRGHVSKRSV